MNMQNQTSKSQLELILDRFLTENAQPDTAAWKQLVQANPAFASEIASAASDWAAMRRVGNEALSYEVSPDETAETFSFALTLLEQKWAEELKRAEKALSEIKGPTVRKEAAAIGLEGYVDLVNSLFIGTVKAPRRVLGLWSQRYGVELKALQEVFYIRFNNRPAPAFNADKKPSLATRPKTWIEAVSALNIDQQEKERLLSMETERDKA